MQRPKFINKSIYHVYNRGVDKRDIFLNNDDRFRFIHDLFEFNDTNPALNLYYKIPSFQSYEVGLRNIRKKPRNRIVNILAFCLMPNHFHLLLEQIQDNGITEFMRKIGTGYTNFFNKKYERSGALFQGKFKVVLVEEEPHFIHLPYYIHLNPLDLVKPQWREKNLTKSDFVKIEKFLEKYRWSSYLDYIGKKNFPSVTQREFLTKFFGGPEQYKKDTIKWLKEMDWETMKDVTLE